MIWAMGNGSSGEGGCLFGWHDKPNDSVNLHSECGTLVRSMKPASVPAALACARHGDEGFDRPCFLLSIKGRLVLGLEVTIPDVRGLRVVERLAAGSIFSLGPATGCKQRKFLDLTGAPARQQPYEKIGDGDHSLEVPASHTRPSCNDSAPTAPSCNRATGVATRRDSIFHGA
eukprot:CAMPEP_0184397700 /NCGR_PEP_ID=MMETSP0007-20130409/62118_1 /TAXON_ID=97485 /ORGANISM="Prymnesium parvum, Strain Texoma1" /LENGTH=172 /DNA_ID=CAMNT_0026751295 /DNA_START=41 /DNA_END=561 /DNA_ORIENTATION=+